MAAGDRFPPTFADVRIFSGQSHPDLAKEICAHLGVPLSPSNTRRFRNDNLFVQLLASVREKEVFIIQSLSPPVSDHVLELLLLLDAARSASARRITAVIPYYSYARSDKKDEPRISIAARLIADLLKTAGASHILTMALHSPQVHGFFSVPTDHLSALSIFAEYFRQKDLSDMVVVSPDIGHAKRARDLARTLGLHMVAANKQRVEDEHVEVMEIIGEVKTRRALIFDDEIATGSTVIETVKALKKRGVERFWVAATHGVFCGPARERFAQIPEIEEIVLTNTVYMPPEKRLPNMVVLSAAPILAEAIRR
ncbi:MAG: ribose-phosphate pyrophosphokinase, partial [Anaerolineae bacterium]|nr:ribose-phosphate pyrophosphokinase [Anaerolineae bacterium]